MWVFFGVCIILLHLTSPPYTIYIKNPCKIRIFCILVLAGDMKKAAQNGRPRWEMGYLSVGLLLGRCISRRIEKVKREKIGRISSIFRLYGGQSAPMRVCTDSAPFLTPIVFHRENEK